MSDAWAALLVLSTAAGAWWARPLPIGWGAAAVLVALGLRRPALLCLGAALLASSLGARAWAGLAPPAGEARWEGWATLVADPVDVRGRLRLEVRLGERRVQAWAGGAQAGELVARLSGERVWLEGEVSALPDEARTRLAPRHLAARLSVDEVGPWVPGDPFSRTGNAVHRMLDTGAAVLPAGQRALFDGLVVGDDRDQPPAVEADFRAAGLTHLLAVSGQNVAFVLAAAGPLLLRVGLRARLAVGLAVLVLFGTATRWEPSVLRAAAMAALTLTAAAAGRPATTRRRLALAVAALLLVDPLLVRSAGFLLSVGASAGIALLAGPLGRALPGPRALAEPLAVTLAAQLGVAPVLVPLFGGLPAAAIPANVLAVPAAGPVTAWGLTGGLLAGAVPPLAPLLHLPTRLLVGWIELVARTAAALPLGWWRGGEVVLLAVLGAAWWLARARDRTRLSRAALCAGLALAIVPRAPAAGGDELVDGARLWRRGAHAVVVADDPDPARLIEALRARGVRRLDVLVAGRGGTHAGATVRAVLSRVPAEVVVAPPGHALPGAMTARPDTTIRAGPFTVVVDEAGSRLEVTVTAGR